MIYRQGRTPGASGTTRSPKTRAALRAILRAGRNAHTPSPSQLDELIAKLNAAVHEYNNRRIGHATRNPEAARIFATTLDKTLRELVRTIERRRAALVRVLKHKPADRTKLGSRVLVMNAETPFTVEALNWLPSIKRWQAVAKSERQQLEGRPRRPRDVARHELACAVADALERTGIMPTSAKNGHFARILREIVFPAIDVPSRKSAYAASAAMKARKLAE